MADVGVMERTAEPARLRPLAREDAPRIQAILSQEAVTTMLAVVPWPYPEDGGATFVAEHVPASPTYALVCAITDANADDEQFRGLVTLRATEGVLRLGYYLDPAVWGRGFATSACRQAIAEGFRRHPATPVEAGVFDDNPGSVRVLEKLGFARVEGELEECVAKARGVGSRLYRMTPEAWRAAQ
ncbi:MAG: GNAT family N-acetyltransferase [Pseudomonadota bacterium]